MSKSHRSLCVSFSRTGVGLCIYHLFVWSNWNFPHISQWITLPSQSCLVLYSFGANLLHSLIMWLIVSSPHRLHLLFCWVLSILESYYYYYYYYYLINRFISITTQSTLAILFSFFYLLIFSYFSYLFFSYLFFLIFLTYFFFREFFISALADSFSLEFEWQQLTSSLQDSS